MARGLVSRSIRTSWALAVIALAGMGCEAEPRALAWSFHLVPESLGSRAVVLEAEVLRGGCGSDVSVYREQARIGEAARRPPLLGPGRYGLRGRVQDDACTWFAAGCLETMLPLAAGSTVEIEITALAVEEPGTCGEDAGSPELDGGEDDAGEVDAPPGTDAGPRDAGLRDAGPRDAGPPDTGPPDTGPPDTGPPDTGPLFPPPVTFGPGASLYVVPAGCSHITAEVWGGGGGGGGDQNPTPTRGDEGTDSSFGMIRAERGRGGEHGNLGSTYAGGAGGNGMGGDVNVMGERGEDGDPMTTRLRSGRGGNAHMGGLGGPGVATSTEGRPGTTPGGGGSGGYGAANGAAGGGAGGYAQRGFAVTPGDMFRVIVGLGGDGGGGAFQGGRGGDGRIIVTCD